MPTNLLKTIDRITYKLIETGFSIDQNYPKILETGNQVVLTWQNQTDIAYVLKNHSYKDIYNRLEKERNFNVKMLDGALIQMMYSFGKKGLLSHRLAFFPSPELEVYQQKPEIYENQELYGDILAKQIIPFPIRFDFDPENHIDIEHPVSHITLGQYKNCRIPVYSPLCPANFVKFILKNFYWTANNQLKPLDGIATHHFDRTITTNEEMEMHLNCVVKQSY